MALVGTREINNVKVEIHASPHGSWSILMPDEGGAGRGRTLGSHATSFEGAVNAARQEIKRRAVKVSVPFKTPDGKLGIANGRHARSDKILTEIEGKKEHIGYRDQIFRHDMPEEVMDHLHELQDEQGKISAEIRSIVSEWKLDLGKAVDDAVNKKAEEAAA